MEHSRVGLIFAWNRGGCEDMSRVLVWDNDIVGRLRG